jgi:diacylglycerol kinase (ATP)
MEQLNGESGDQGLSHHESQIGPRRRRPLRRLHDPAPPRLGRHRAAKPKGDYATKLAQGAVREGCNVTVDCGGDSTLTEIVEGVIGTDAAVGTIPGGTANLWAHEFSISERRRVDVGYVEVNSRHGQHFLLLAGIGFDGAIIGRLDIRLKNRLGPLAVGLAAVEALPSLHAVPVQIEMDTLHWQGGLSQLVMGNTRRYAGFTRMTPDALIDDGMLDVCLITAKGAVSAGRQLGSLAQRPRPTSSETYRAASVTVHSPVSLPLELDGGEYDMDHVEPTEDGVV